MTRSATRQPFPQSAGSICLPSHAGRASLNYNVDHLSVQSSTNPRRLLRGLDSLFPGVELGFLGKPWADKRKSGKLLN